MRTCPRGLSSLIAELKARGGSREPPRGLTGALSRRHLAATRLFSAGSCPGSLHRDTGGLLPGPACLPVACTRCRPGLPTQGGRSEPPRGLPRAWGAAPADPGLWPSGSQTEEFSRPALPSPVPLARSCQQRARRGLAAPRPPTRPVTLSASRYSPERPRRPAQPVGGLSPLTPEQPHSDGDSNTDRGVPVRSDLVGRQVGSDVSSAQRPAGKPPTAQSRGFCRRDSVSFPVRGREAGPGR